MKFLIAYLVAAIVFLCINPALADGGWSKALINGAVLGFLAYGAYDVTNAATFVRQYRHQRW